MIKLHLIQKIKITLATCIILIPTIVFAEIEGIKNTLINIEASVNDSVHKAEQMFEEREGKNMKGSFSFIRTNKIGLRKISNIITSKSTEYPLKENLYLSILRILPDFKIEIKLAGNVQSTDLINSPVSRELLGSEIILLPIYNKNDKKITSWECLTNADAVLQEFKGNSGIKEYAVSLIRKYTDNIYLSVCTYINRSLVNN